VHLFNLQVKVILPVFIPLVAMLASMHSICVLFLHWHAASLKPEMRSLVVGQDGLLETVGHFSDKISSTANRTQGPCTKSFYTADAKFTKLKGIWDILATFDDLDPGRDEYEPRERCVQSANAGTHAFLTMQLLDALKQAPGGTAAVDIGSGTGFLLSVFKQNVKEDVTVIGIDTDHGAVEHFKSLNVAGVS